MSAALKPRPTKTSLPTGELLAVVREYLEAARFDAADRLLGHVLADDPWQPEGLHLAGFVAFKQGRTEQAAALMERGLTAGASAPRQLCNLAEVYRILGRIDAGLALVRRATALTPTDATCHFNAAMLHYEARDTGSCIRAARRAIALQPDMPEAHMRLGQALLLTGAYAESWAEYEWRYQIGGAQPLMPATFVAHGARPQWDGAALPEGRRLLLVADQGFGDVLMFARYLPWAMARAREVVVACSSELVGLLARNFPGPAYHSRWDDVGEYAVYCPLSGLPRLAGTQVADLRSGPAYVSGDPGRSAAAARWLDTVAPSGGLRVGLGWAGRPSHNNDRNRSVPLSVLAPLAAVPGVTFVSLQKGPAAAQAATWPGPLIDPQSQIETFEDTAALLEHLDLVVAVDTSVVHLAGAMGRPAWALIPFAPDWRWLAGRMDTPWYGALTLYRQADAGDWEPVVERMAEDLALRAGR